MNISFEIDKNRVCWAEARNNAGQLLARLHANGYEEAWERVIERPKCASGRVREVVENRATIDPDIKKALEEAIIAKMIELNAAPRVKYAPVEFDEYGNPPDDHEDYDYYEL